MDERLLTAAIVILGVPAALVGYVLLIETILKFVPGRIAPKLRPMLWLLPALTFLGVFLVYPTIDTVRRSFMDGFSENFVGWANYEYVFTSAETLGSLVNNLLWIVLLTAGSVGFGLLIAVLVDRVRYESWIKAVIFLPLAISFTAAGIIWRFMYDFRPESGTLNAIVVALGGEPIGWLNEWPLNTVLLIVVGIWMQVGFCMVILSAGLKGISTELLEASRVDGANEWQVFRSITFPLLLPTIAVISTTVVIIALKAFDIVYIMTNGNFGTEVLANRMYKELFNFSEFGRGSAVAVILFLAIVPVMVLNIKRFREQEAIR
jgi:alpha-glucoside transport system permease protein